MPSSSRACAPIASCAMSCSVTCFASAGSRPRLNVDCRQFPALASIVRSEFRPLTRKIGLFGVCLRVDRHILTRRHRYSPGNETCDPCNQYTAATSMRGRNTQDQTRGRKDAIVRTQYSRPQPTDMLGAMPFSRTSKHSSSSRLVTSRSSTASVIGASRRQQSSCGSTAYILVSYGRLFQPFR